jgi:hypothetical protein
MPTLMRMLTRSAAVVMMISVVEIANACPVCYGDPQSSTSDGLTYAIVALLSITGGVLSGVVAFFVYVRKRSKLTLNGSVDAPSLN